ncbi:MAG: hypothetical protein Aurels2KO_54910 [Aureliella sp.]
MKQATRIVEQRHAELLQSVEETVDQAASGEPRYRQVGQRYRTVPSAQAPLLAFMVQLTNGNTIEVKYSHITERQLILHDAKEEKNLIVIRVRDSLQIKIVGFNLAQLNEDFLRQAVLDVGAIAELQVAAAAKEDKSQPIVSGLQIEYGRMDMENGVWMPGSGTWSDAEQRWVPNLKR